MNFNSQKVQKTLAILEEQFLLDDRPWVITFSGGKDSTTVLHLVVEMLIKLKKENKNIKKVFVVSSDTMVEMPVIEDYFFEKIKQLDKFIKKTNINMETVILKPKVTESFWTLLLGRGYPSPNQTFRWCTDRMKIKPATYFLTSLANKHKSILMLLGVRSSESQARAISIEKRDLNHRGFSKHDTIPNAFTYSPVKDWTNADVWSFLSANPAPWGVHQDMMKLYDKGSGESDCNIALNPESPSCGKTRFGCWVCTVVSKDKSMENMIRNEEDQWMKPLHHFRNKLEKYRYDETKRQQRRRNGQKAKGPFLLEIRQKLFEELLRIEQDLKPKLKNKTLISDDEIEQIQKEWLHDGDFFETAITLANKYARDIAYESKKTFSEIEREYVKSICKEENIELELIDKIIQAEHKYRHQLKRSGVLTEVEDLIEAYSLGKINAV